MKDYFEQLFSKKLRTSNSEEETMGILEDYRDQVTPEDFAIIYTSIRSGIFEDQYCDEYDIIIAVDNMNGLISSSDIINYVKEKNV